MNDFELKFYHEWYDALSELSHDDRAEAALALLGYVSKATLWNDIKLIFSTFKEIIAK